MAAPSMAEVVLAHLADPDEASEYERDLADQIAQALAAAGFGHVASVEAERDRWKAAWEMADPLLTEHDRLAAQVAAVRDVLAEHWDWKAGRVLHAAVLAALDGEATR